MINRKPVFDAVRTMLGRGFTKEEVGQLDAAIDLAEASLRAEPGPEPGEPSIREIGDKGIDLIKSFEGCARPVGDGRFEAYPDPGSANGEPWTIGWGSTGRDIRKGTVWTQQECDDRFRKDLVVYADAVARALGSAPTTQSQFDALVSFHYNTGAIHSATLTRKHKEGKFAEAEKQFMRWIYNDGKMLPGLKRRREAEAALYSS